MTEPTYRETVRPIVAEVLRQNKGADEQQIVDALHKAYPFGDQRGHAYKVWREEIRRQSGIRIDLDKPGQID